MVDMHMYVQAKARLPGRLMDRNSNFYSPKIIWGLCEDLPDSVGLVTVKRKGTIISCLLLLCITVFFFSGSEILHVWSTHLKMDTAK